jgi:hypothetical protein
MRSRDKRVIDMINAGAYYSANQAGVYGKPNMDIAQMGIAGAASTDMMESELALQNGKINRQQYEEQIANTYRATAEAVIANYINMGIDVVKTFVEAKLPILIPIVEPVVAVIKTYINPVVSKVVDGGRKTFNWIKDKLKKLL